MNAITRRILFLLFFVSGFSSLIYQVVWTRMAFASFGIITPVLSVVISVFMLGLAAGSLAGGWLIAWLVKKTGISAAIFYAAAELTIGLGAFAVPQLFAISERVLLPTGQMNSLEYLGLSAIALGISILPWCFCMGTTFPFMMAFVRERDSRETRSFSFLYVANVLGAMVGTFLTAFALVELFGFRHTLLFAACGNFGIAAISVMLGISGKRREMVTPETVLAAQAPVPSRTSPLIKTILFSTGFISMAMEVVWSRAFTIVLKTQVYAFAAIVFTYLFATLCGSLAYRRDLRRKTVRSSGVIFSALAVTALFPVMVNDPHVIPEDSGATIYATQVFMLLASIFPICALLGYLTPRLIDEFSAGQPRAAGEAYAINVIGCILGPLVACYVLLPHISEQWSLIVLGLPFVFFWLLTTQSQPRFWRVVGGVATAIVIGWSLFFSTDFEHYVLAIDRGAVARRDYMASVISYGHARQNKSLLVNGFGMTVLASVTKFMAHLPLSFHEGKPKSVLVICFGMGTTYRAALTWDVDVTAVELVPSVVKAFRYYHDNAEQCFANPHSHVVIDDGRRYLRRCARKFDVIIVDPPPPVEAAGSSLLFSSDFYGLAKEHLNRGGILQMWYPGPQDFTRDATVRSMYESFPYVRCFGGIDNIGIHMLGSMEPIPQLDGRQLAERMPAAARKDLIEWDATQEPSAFLQMVLNNEIPIILNANPEIEVTDDRPFNEYFLLRRIAGKTGEGIPFAVRK